jgi:hypothetical protein
MIGSLTTKNSIREIWLSKFRCCLGGGLSIERLRVHVYYMNGSGVHGIASIGKEHLVSCVVVRFHCVLFLSSSVWFAYCLVFFSAFC